MKLNDIPLFNIYDIFAQYPDVAPKSLKDMPNLIQRCREENRHDLAKYLEEWVKHVEEKISQERTEV